MYIGNYEITKREVIVAIAVTLMLIGIGFLIGGVITDVVTEANENYYKALHIENDVDTFKYSLNTNVGYALCEGVASATEPVSIPEIQGEYFYIKKVKEEYTRHTRQVAHHYTDSKGHSHTYYTTEVYYTWDYRNSWSWQSPQTNFLGVTFDNYKFNLASYNYQYDIQKESSSIRYVYYVVPKEVYGTLFTNIVDNDITEPNFSRSTIEEIIADKEKSADFWVTVFWVAWVLIIIAADIGYVLLENRYLED